MKYLADNKVDGNGNNVLFANLYETIIANLACLGFSVTINLILILIALIPGCKNCLMNTQRWTTFIFIRESSFSLMSFVLLTFVYAGEQLEDLETLSRLAEAMGWVRASGFLVFVIVVMASICKKLTSKQERSE